MVQIAAALIAALVSIGVWYLSARDLRRRDRENKKRELRLNYLIEAYRTVGNACHRSQENSHEYTKPLEKAIADIQLFGNPAQVHLARELAEQLTKESQTDFSSLLLELRDNLRCELNLEPLGIGLLHLRIKEGAKTVSAGRMDKPPGARGHE